MCNIFHIVCKCAVLAPSMLYLPFDLEIYANILNIKFVFSFGMIVLFNMKLWPLHVWAHTRSCFTALLDIDRRVIGHQ